MRFGYCPIAEDPDDHDEAAIRRLLMSQRIAVVGLSDDPMRASHTVAKFLLDSGRSIVPVNPKIDQVLGQRCYADLADIPGKIDLVNVFRRAEYSLEVVRSAIQIRAAGVWLQSGIRSPDARESAELSHLPYVEDRCLMVELARRK
jgi:predicted CoA-binding protein